MDYILALDQGTTSSRAILYNDEAKPVGVAQKEFEQIFPQPGYVEHNATEIWESQIQVIKEVITQQNIDAANIRGIGITNQRETTVIWDRKTGEPVHNAIVWQDRRTSSLCDALVRQGHEKLIQEKTGLLIDSYFSGTKVNWLLDNVPGVRERAKKGELAFGTMDSWLIWKLTDGALHITDVTNASRTLLFNIHTMKWDEEILQLLDIPNSLLPEVKPSSYAYGKTARQIMGSEIPIAGIAGDQQAALFGQMCISPGMAKCTYGTGCFLVMNTGSEIVKSNHKLLSTIAWQIGDQVTYALEGSVFVGGAAIQWLRDGLKIIQSASESKEAAERVDSNGGVVFVPALVGLGAPHWDPDARGAIFGITRGTRADHLVRATLESICLQVNDLLTTMHRDTGKQISSLRIDGGATANDLLVQLQADLSDIHIERPVNLETTALGAAYLAGLGIGLWKMEDLRNSWKSDQNFDRKMHPNDAKKIISNWNKAVERSKKWSSEP